MKITEKLRLDMALAMIEEASAYAQSTNPERDWKASQDAVCKIYEIIHSIRCPKCRENHPRWVQQIDDEIISSSRK